MKIDTMVDAMVNTMRNIYGKDFHDNEIQTFVSKMVEDGHVIQESEAFAFYVTVDDETLDKIKTEPGYILNKDNLEKMLKGKGDNVHFFGLASTNTKGLVTRDILKGLKDILEKEHPKSVSWWNKAMTQITTRRLSCQTG
jgi:hypothetical protein|tara:strand:+ start:2322 stop:2741 length:420 start_codon:yes stop_codon:yes gene_type:complete